MLLEISGLYYKTAFSMDKFRHRLKIEYENEYKNEYCKMKSLLFSKPRIYDAGGDLSKRWYVYFYYRNPQTGKMERQSPIYQNANRIKDARERRKYLTDIRNVLEKMLNEGCVPTAYQKDAYSENKEINIKDAIELAINNAKAVMKESSFKDYSYRLKRFEKWLNEKQVYGNITNITKKTVTNFLNETLETTSAKNRNNLRANLSIFFSFLEENEYVAENFVKKIKVINAKPERNKTYTPNQAQTIFETLQKQDKELHLFIKFISYNFLRPLEVCRLKVKDIDIKNASLTIQTKNKTLKTQIIPKILLQDLYFLENKKPDNFLFTPFGFAQEWNVSEVGRRDYWTKRFSKIKKQLGLGKDYTMYSFRHTYITHLYRELRKSYTPFETKSNIMLITGHSTMTALEKYLRDIDAELPEDYSHLLETNDKPLI